MIHLCALLARDSLSPKMAKEEKTLCLDIIKNALIVCLGLTLVGSIAAGFIINSDYVNQTQDLTRIKSRIVIVLILLSLLVFIGLVGAIRLTYETLVVTCMFSALFLAIIALATPASLGKFCFCYNN